MFDTPERVLPFPSSCTPSPLLLEMLEPFRTLVLPLTWRPASLLSMAFQLTALLLELIWTPHRLAPLARILLRGGRRCRRRASRSSHRPSRV